MTALDAPILSKLGRMVPRLGSNQDAEVVATVHAIARTLASVGADWHDLASALHPPAPPVPRPLHGGEDLRAVADWLARHIGLLEPREADFVMTAGSLVSRGQPLSEKQREWLLGIRDRLKARTAKASA